MFDLPRCRTGHTLRCVQGGLLFCCLTACCKISIAHLLDFSLQWRNAWSFTCIAAKARDEKLADRQKAPNVAPLKDLRQRPPASPEQQDTWGFFQWDRYATSWEVSSALHDAPRATDCTHVSVALKPLGSKMIVHAVHCAQQSWHKPLTTWKDDGLLHDRG